MATKQVKASKSAKAASKVQKAAKPSKAAKVVKVAAKAQTTNPYRPGSSYAAVVDGLRALGVGKAHALDKAVAAVRKAMGADAWKVFAARDARNEATGKNAEGRLTQNIAVVARKDYGEPLLKIGFKVLFDGKKKTAGLFKL